MADYRREEAKEASRAMFRGVWAAITTPMTPDYQIDEEGLRRNMRYLTEELHIDGVFCTGIMGEVWSLTKEERKRSVELVVEESRGKCLVIAHTGHHSAHETIELTRHAEETGAEFAIIINPYFPPANDRMVYEWYKFVADRVDIGIWMFDTGFAGYGLSAEVTAKVAELPNICGIKIVRPLEHYLEVQRLTKGSIVMSDPSEPAWLERMRDQGQQVYMSSPVPYLCQTPSWQPMREYTELGLSGDFDGASRVATELDELRPVYEKWMEEPWRRDRVVPIAYLKAWSELLGMPAGPVRPPLVGISDAEREELRSDLERSGLLAKLGARADRVAGARSAGS